MNKRQFKKIIREEVKRAINENKHDSRNSFEHGDMVQMRNRVDESGSVSIKYKLPYKIIEAADNGMPMIVEFGFRTKDRNDITLKDYAVNKLGPRMRQDGIMLAKAIKEGRGVLVFKAEAIPGRGTKPIKRMIHPVNNFLQGDIRGHLKNLGVDKRVILETVQVAMKNIQ